MASGIIVTNGCLQDKFSIEDHSRGGKKFIPATQDGVFSNLMAKPEVIRIDQLEQDVVDKPPTYSQAALNNPPSYLDSLYHAYDYGDVVINGYEVGSIAVYIFHLVAAIVFHVIGVAIGLLLSNTHAGWYGSIGGLGVLLLFLGISIEDNPSIAPDVRPIVGVTLFMGGYAIFMISILMYQNAVEKARNMRIESSSL